MKSAVRNQLAAVMFLAPVSAAMLMQPAAAQHPQRAVVAQPGVTTSIARPAPVIDRFVMRTPGKLEPGRELRFRLHGTPGSDAWLDIPGVIRGVDLVEARPGVYEGTYTVRRRDDLRAFANARGVLQTGNQRAMAKVDVRDRDRDYGDRRDESPPQITDLMPAEGERISGRGRAHIFARLADEGSGVDPATVRLRIDGRDVTARTSITTEEVRFREDLERGPHTAELVVGDKAGNVVKKSWTFRVVDRDRRG